MNIFQYFRHDWPQNVIRRNPPSRLFRLLKNAWQPEKYYAGIFDNHKSNFIPLLPTVSGYASDVRNFKFKYYLPFRKIDPRIVSSALATAPKINKKILTNVINHLHFTEEHVSIHIKDITTGEEFLQQADPGPCFNSQFTICLTDPGVFDLKCHVPLNLVIDNRKSLIVFPINLQAVDQKSLVLKMPDLAYSYSKRQAVRHACEGVDAEIVQGQLNVHGVLDDINPHDLRVNLNVPDDINSANPLFLKLSQRSQTYFMGECQILRSDKDRSYVILQPIHSNRPVLKPRRYPNDRVRIIPQPVIQFIHPLCGLAVQNKVDDISTSGFSITVPHNESLLIPGLIIPNITLQLPGMSNDLKCTAQVIYRHKQNKDEARYGFYILDMSLQDQRRLFDAVNKVIDPHVNIAGKVNMDSLWELFFDSGFIYPDKYGLISPYTEALKETYRKLYADVGRNIFTHVTYQDQGQVYAHMSMVKAYENSWIIHHLAARPMRGKRTGLKVLNHFVNYIDCLYRLPVSSKTMRYNFCYYRPENSFSDYYFGGIYRTLKRRESCSLDLFAYMSVQVEPKTIRLPDEWSIEQFSKDELIITRDYYGNYGGGMMLDAFALECRAEENDIFLEKTSDDPLNRVQNNIRNMYQDAGLKRDSQVFSIKHHGKIKAAVIVDTSDLGVNMSELLNSIKIIVIDNSLPWSILKDSVSVLGKVYGIDKIMILVFPLDYLEHQGVECKKRYYLWVINTNLDANEKDIVKEHIRIAKRKFITEKFIKEIAKNRLMRLLAKSGNQSSN